jgi:hypothetical protein
MAVMGAFEKKGSGAHGSQVQRFTVHGLAVQALSEMTGTQGTKETKVLGKPTFDT